MKMLWDEADLPADVLAFLSHLRLHRNPAGRMQMQACYHVNSFFLDGSCIWLVALSCRAGVVRMEI